MTETETSVPASMASAIWVMWLDTCCTSMSAVDEVISVESVILCAHATSFIQKLPASKATSQCVPVLLLSPILFTLRFA